MRPPALSNLSQETTRMNDPTPAPPKACCGLACSFDRAKRTEGPCCFFSPALKHLFSPSFSYLTAYLRYPSVISTLTAFF